MKKEEGSSDELKRFEVVGEIGFWVRARNRSGAEKIGEGVIEKFLDGRLYKDDEVFNPWVDLKNVVEVND